LEKNCGARINDESATFRSLGEARISSLPSAGMIGAGFKRTSMKNLYNRLCPISFSEVDIYAVLFEMLGNLRTCFWRLWPSGSDDQLLHNSSRWNYSKLPGNYERESSLAGNIYTSEQPCKSLISNFQKNKNRLKKKRVQKIEERASKKEEKRKTDEIADWLLTVCPTIVDSRILINISNSVDLGSMQDPGLLTIHSRPFANNWLLDIIQCNT
jgi:hypothetical protein